MSADLVVLAYALARVGHGDWFVPAVWGMTSAPSPAISTPIPQDHR